MSEGIVAWLQNFISNDYIIVFIVSMLPIIELRGAIPIGVGLGLPVLPTFLVSVIGNMLPVPFLILFGRKVLDWCAKIPKIGGFFQKVIDKATQKASQMGKAEFWGLFIFVGIPLPGTGAWTGSVVATILQMRLWKATLAILLGVLTAGVIMSLLSLGVFSALHALI